MYLEDTIAAISTPHGTGGIGIIRISGKKAFEIGGILFSGKKPFDRICSHTINYGRIIDPADGEMVDEVLLSRMDGPNTFTREDVVEINCHGGTVVLMRILELIIKEGARPAEPGEFTKRAFLNGRMDLSQAEAVIDLINAKTGEGSRAAAAQLEGKLSREVGSARKRLIELLAHIEVTVDYPEHDLEEMTGRQVCDEASKIIRSLERISESFGRGRILREGIKAVIAGKPNVGKSSLLNEFAGKNRAIVTDIPGTTRDIIEEYISVKGIPVKLSDTAGIRYTADPVERMGVEKAENAMDTADVVILMLDVSRGLDADDRAIISKLSGKKAINVIYVINKTDMVAEPVLSAMEQELYQMYQLYQRDGSSGSLYQGDGSSGTMYHGDGSSGTISAVNRENSGDLKVIRASMLLGRGLDVLEATIAEMFMKGSVSINNEVLVTNVRHKSLLDKAAESLRDACRAYGAGMPLDMVTIDIRNAADYLGRITGESVSEDVVHEIFSRFCIGK